MTQIRREVLKAFKKLHRTRELIFQGDERALAAGRNEINHHFRKNKNETNPEEIKKMIKVAEDADKELRTNVIQAVKKDEGVYELRITEGTTRLENFTFNPDAVIERPRRKRDAKSGCCGGATPEVK